LELLSTGTRERIELRAPVVLGLLPLCGDPAFLLELVQGGVERAFADLKHLLRDDLQPAADRPPVERLDREELQDQEIECALDEIAGPAHLMCPPVAPIGDLGESSATPLGKQGESSW